MPEPLVTREIVKLAQPIRTVELSVRIGAAHLAHAHVSETRGGTVVWVSQVRRLLEATAPRGRQDG